MRVKVLVAWWSLEAGEEVSHKPLKLRLAARFGGPGPLDVDTKEDPACPQSYGRTNITPALLSPVCRGRRCAPLEVAPGPGIDRGGPQPLEACPVHIRYAGRLP
jgi:hypothetical protein